MSFSESEELLAAAAAALDRSAGAPDWLRAALVSVQSVVADLVPAAQSEAPPPEFFYPH